LTTERDFIESTAEATVGGFRAIKKIRGLLTDIQKVDPNPNFTASEYGPPKEQIQFTLEQAAILEVFPSETAPELREGKFTDWIPYALPGKSPSSGSVYMRTWVASSEELGKEECGQPTKPSARLNTWVTLERQRKFLFKRPMMEKDENTKKEKPIVDAEGNKIYEEFWTPRSAEERERYFCFVGDEGASSKGLEEHIRDGLNGSTEPTAMRFLVMDARAKQFPEYKDTLKAGGLVALAEKLGMQVGEDLKIVKAEDGNT